MSIVFGISILSKLLKDKKKNTVDLSAHTVYFPQFIDLNGSQRSTWY